MSCAGSRKSYFVLFLKIRSHFFLKHLSSPSTCPRQAFAKMDEPEDSLETAKIRPRFAASAEALVAVLIKHVTRPNKIKYGEDIGNSKVEPKMLQQNAALLLDLAGLHPNMSFSSKTMKQATMVVEQHYHDKWNLSPEEALNFRTKSRKGFGACARTLAQRSDASLHQHGSAASL